MLTTGARFGLVPFTSEPVEPNRSILPLKSVQCWFLVGSGLAEVEMTQVYRQEHARPLDCHYQFPVPTDVSVYLCEAFINDRVIRA